MIIRIIITINNSVVQRKQVPTIINIASSSLRLENFSSTHSEAGAAKFV